MYAKPQLGQRADASPTTLPQYLATVPPERCGAVVLPWTMFGSSNRAHHPISVIDSCRQREADTGRGGVRRGASNRIQVGNVSRRGSPNALVKTVTRRSALCQRPPQVGTSSFNEHTSVTHTPKCLATQPADPNLYAIQGYDAPPNCTTGFNDEGKIKGPQTEWPRGVPVPGAALQLNHYPLQSWEWFWCAATRKAAASAHAGARATCMSQAELSLRLLTSSFVRFC